MTKPYLYPWDGEVYEIHLPDHERSIRQVSMTTSSTNTLPWAVFWTSGTSEEGSFHSFVQFPYQCWFTNAIILSLDQRFNACRVGRSGDFSLQQDWIVIRSKPELFLFIKPKVVDFQYWLFLSWGQLLGFSNHFSKLSSRENSVCTKQRFGCCWSL